MKVDNKFKFYRKGLLRKIYTLPIRIIFWVGLLFHKHKLGINEYGRENLKSIKGRGALVVYSHNVPLDAFFVVRQLSWRMPYMPAQASSFNKGWFLNNVFLAMNVVPIPESFRLLPRFFNQMEQAIVDKQIVAIAPEGQQRLWSNELIAFKDGAFKIAEKVNAPIVPVVFKIKNKKSVTMIWGKVIEGNYDKQYIHEKMAELMHA